ncbi:MAG: SPOR domain-containing protein [Dysgonomonas sp.]|nr:SPOR domain-containing protein [Dysgonomonas sp.]
MKRIFYIVFVFCFSSVTAFAQSEDKTIIEELNSSRWGQGNIKVIQDESIQKVVGVRHAQSEESTGMLGAIDPSANYVEARGYKIQVFSGNNQAKSKREAESKKAQVKGVYPELEATVTFDTPFWRLRVGNFLNREDAEIIMNEMKKTFPSFGKEMRVVSATVKRQVHN